MKKLTDTQKKWALTACLASVLSFNLVMGLTGSNYGSTSLASAKLEAEAAPVAAPSKDPNIKFEAVTSSFGEVLPVKYIRQNDKTMAVVPEVLQSGVCYKCGENYLLPKEFNSSAADLEAALRKAMGEKTGKADKAAAPSDSDDVKAEDKDIAALKKKCEHKEDDDRTECFASGLTNLLTDKHASNKAKKKKEYKKEDVMALFIEEIQPGLISGLKDISDLLPSRRMHNDPFADMDTEKDNRREKTQNLVEDMISSIGKKYNYLRQRLTAIAAKAVLSNQEAAQLKLKQADQLKTANPSQALRLQSEGFARMNAASQIANQIGGSLSDGLSSAQWSNLITQDQFDNLYQTNYADVVTAAIQGLSANQLTYVIPSVPLSNGSVIVDGSGQSYTLTPSKNPLTQRAVGRGITVIPNGLTPGSAHNLQRMNGSATPGTATIQVFQATPAPAAAQNTGAPRTSR
jgi:hypothetical protein